MKRREFLRAGAAAAACLGSSTPRSGARVLVLGGTRYFGPVLVEELLAHGATVTLFNRGKTNPHLFPKLEKLRGDRELPDASGLKSLANSSRTRDWVVDTWRGDARCVGETARLLCDRVRHYQYVSTVSVYDRWDRIRIREDEPLNPIPPRPPSPGEPYRYAIRKTLAEQQLREVLPGRSAFFRSHGMRGYPTSAPRHEPYWQVKVMRGRDLVVPAQIEHYQVTDMVSLARFMIRCAREGKTGPYNVAYPPLRFSRFIDAIVKHTRSTVQLHWIPDKFLQAQGVTLLRG
ncbi:MAG: hypothetical protein AAFY60_10260, partial [Myxococcota bacterium]